ncbi:MAG: hypothetical protein ACPGE8_07845, partial [Candidatus Poseidoniaceae archaeon]
MASGDVRFTFRSDETDVNVTIEGKRAWVEGIVEELGLSDVGVMLPIGVQSPLQDLPSQTDEDSEDDDVLLPPSDMGPEPDPSRI